ncbi:MAG: N-acetyl-gamma-glutamyl-phosphate reductase [Ruminococcaceae bacterium]|nr:N-acetyl-gamma-glutamyl-phosphate reductase [Oscillospiraceae bacterium]
MKKYKISVIGASGYAGAELVRILLSHPNAELAALSSVSYTGQSLADLYPAYRNICEQLLVSEEEAIEKGDVVFASLPHGLSQEIALKCDKAGKLFIDLGADFRLDDGDVYTEWYGKEYVYPELHAKQVYGLSEIYRDDVKNTKIIGNPGCYPTSVALASYPAIKNGLVKGYDFIIDSKSGVTGAGKSLTQKTHYPECNEAFSPYNIGKHRHTPEIEQTLSRFAGEKVSVTFVPHLLPVNRGIISTIYANKADGITLEKVHEIYTETYKNERFVRVLPLGDVANLRNVRMSNYCDISVHEDKHTGKLILVSAIDNMFKGAAGQAVQNMNIALGLDEAAGIDFVPPAI